MNLRDWFQRPSSTLTYDWNAPKISADIMGVDPVILAVQPQALYNLADYPTPFAAVFNRPKTTITSGI